MYSTGANQHMHKSAVNIHWLQIAKVESNNTGQAPLKHLHSPIDCGTLHKMYILFVESLCTLFSWSLPIIPHTQEMLLRALAPTHPSTSRLLHQAPECSRWSLQVPLQGINDAMYAQIGFKSNSLFLTMTTADCDVAAVAAMLQWSRRAGDISKQAKSVWSTQRSYYAHTD